MKFLFKCRKIFHNWALQTSEISMNMRIWREISYMYTVSPKQPCNFLFYYIPYFFGYKLHPKLFNAIFLSLQTENQAKIHSNSHELQQHAFQWCWLQPFSLNCTYVNKSEKGYVFWSKVRKSHLSTQTALFSKAANT